MILEMLKDFQENKFKTKIVSYLILIKKIWTQKKQNISQTGYKTKLYPDILQKYVGCQKLRRF